MRYLVGLILVSLLGVSIVVWNWNRTQLPTCKDGGCLVAYLSLERQTLWISKEYEETAIKQFGAQSTSSNRWTISSKHRGRFNVNVQQVAGFLPPNLAGKPGPGDEEAGITSCCDPEEQGSEKCTNTARGSEKTTISGYSQSKFHAGETSCPGKPFDIMWCRQVWTQVKTVRSYGQKNCKGKNTLKAPDQSLDFAWVCFP